MTAKISFRLVVFVAAIALVGAQFARAQSAQTRPKRHATIPIATRDGTRIAFQTDRHGGSQIYSMKPDGSDERRLTHSGGSDMGPDWSPDGKWLIFASGGEEGQPMKIERINADGSERQTIVTEKEIGWPRISPDARQIVYTGFNEKDAHTIFIVNVDGTGRKAFPSGLEQAWDAEWSPDGKQLLFAAFPTDSKNPSKNTSSIYVADVSGANRRLLATVPGLIQLPRWSPDGRQIAYQTYTAGEEADIILVDFPSGKFRTITRRDRPYLDETPSWLPDGRLLFQTTRDGTFEVYRMKSDGSGAERISK